VKTIRVALALPWYDGADKDCVGSFLVFQHYLGRLQERLWWENRQGRSWEQYPLDPADPGALIPDWLLGTDLEFMICDAIGYSLPGTAREVAIDKCLALGADYILFYDADMIFTSDVFLRLLRHQLPVVGALAFTGREPLTPVMYEFKTRADGKLHSSPIHDYKRDSLQQVGAIGFGVVLIQASVFRKLPKPWFSAPGIGEDIQFAVYCQRAGIPIHMDTSAKAIHKPRYAPEWHSEEKYLTDRDPVVKAAREEFERVKAARWAIIKGDSKAPDTARWAGIKEIE